jgi:hypothetical protein
MTNPNITFEAKKTRAKKVLEKIVESGGTKAVSKAMREVGYSEGHCRNPHLFTRTKLWQDIIEEYLPDELLARKHKELLTKMDEKGELDTQATARALDMAYKIKNKYQQQQTNVQINNFIPLLGGDSKKNVSENNGDRENIVAPEKN